jgi:hypothetical protein
MLKLERQFVLEFRQLILVGEVIQGGNDKTLRDLERGFHLDFRGRARVQNRQHPCHRHGEKANCRDRDKNLRSERAVVPKLLQHALKISMMTNASQHLVEANGKCSFDLDLTS